MSRPSLSALLGALTVFAIASASSAAENRAAWFTTPGHPGAVVLDVPAGWSYDARTSARPTTVKMDTGESVVRFTLLWNAGNAPDYNSPEQLKTWLYASAASYAPKAADEGITIENLAGSEASGVYTDLVNPDLETDEHAGKFRVLTPGIVSVGELQVFFTMISIERDTAARKLALEMFRGARFEADASSRIDTSKAVSLTVEDGLPVVSPDPQAPHAADGHQH